MIRLPDEIMNHRDLRLFFIGMKAGVVMASQSLGKKRPVKPGVVDAADLLHDLEIFEKSCKSLVPDEARHG